MAQSGQETPLVLSGDDQAGAGMIVESRPNSHLDFGSKRLNNNLWGAPPEEKLATGVHLKADETFGWHWERSAPLTKPGLTDYQPIYPNIRIGGCPWAGSVTPRFPVKVGDIKTLEFAVDYSYAAPPDGVYNFAYDLFLSDIDQASPDPRPKAEIMIWLRHTLQQPPEVYRGDFSDGINAYELYSFMMPKDRMYYAFVMKAQAPLQGRHVVNAAKLMDFLGLDRGWYLHGVELGNEVISGSGAVDINRFRVTLNGRES